MFGRKELWKIFGPENGKVKVKRTKLHNENLHDLYSSPNTVRVIKPKRIRWAGNPKRIRRAGNVARMAKRRGEYRGLVGKPEESDCIEDLGVD
jgi:hypothetical protein